MAELFDGLAAAPQLIDPRMGLQNAVEHGVHVRDIGADDTRRIRHDDGGFHRGFLNRIVGFVRPAAIAAVGRHQCDDLAADLVEMRQDQVDVLARDAARAIAIRRQRVLYRMCPLGDRRLPHYARSAFERMREAQQARHRSGAAAVLLQLEDALRELIEQVARLGTEVAVRILRHAVTPRRRSVTPPYAA